MAKHTYVATKDITTHGGVKIEAGATALELDTPITVDEALAGIRNGHFVTESVWKKRQETAARAADKARSQPDKPAKPTKPAAAKTDTPEPDKK